MDEVFRCTPYAVVMTVSACLKRQLAVRRTKSRLPLVARKARATRVHLSRCADCALGRSVAAAGLQREEASERVEVGGGR